MLDNPKADDTLLAAGIAIANGVPSLYVVPERKSLPWFLREADQTYPGTVHILEEPIPAAAKKVIKQGGESLYGARADVAPIGASVDTFIGCLMSGLSETQYTEGRNHLLAIDTALKEEFGASKNHCEGIMVASTNTFGTPKESLAMDVEAIRAADRCVFYLYDGQPRPSGMWVEAGVAIGLDKPCTFLVPSKDALPPALRGEALPKGVEVVVYSDHDALLEGLKSRPAQLLGEAPEAAEASKLQATLAELRATLPAGKAVEASAGPLHSLLALTQALRERYDVAAARANAADAARVKGMAIHDTNLVVPEVRDVAKHLLGLVADPGSGPIARTVNGTWMIARHGQDLDAVMKEWNTARDLPEKRIMYRAQDQYAHVNTIYAAERDAVSVLAAALEVGKGARWRR